MTKKIWFPAAVISIQLSTLTGPANAGLVSMAKMPMDGGYMVFELYDDPAIIAECRGKNASGAIARLEKGNTKADYGSGCWTADLNGYVNLFIKSFDDGRVRESKIHNSKFIANQTASSNSPEKDVRNLMKQEEALSGECRGGSGSSPKTIAACDKRDKVFEQIKKLGWCWGTDGQAGYERGWVRCAQ